MNTVYNVLVILILSLAGLVFLLLFHISAPYGKFLRKGWGPSVRSKWAWMFMEAPSPILMAIFFFTSDEKSVLQILFICLWMSHYIHRTLIYPFTQSGGNKSYPLILVCMAFIFNCLNGFINGYGVFHLLSYDLSWLKSWQFSSGILIFVTGFVINKTADEKLRMLRRDTDGDYILPEGWLFKYISCPHYFGEIIEWGCWALMTWSLPGLAFFVFTFANLFPRGMASHKWYKSKFPDYPSGRKAVIPFII
jgi:protein-S-isoprenylcysteine O-methyltransferase Ste14